MPPSLSVVVLTWNEQDNIGACLMALAKQTTLDFEAIVVDAASTDSTVAEVLRLQPTLPYPLRVVVAESRISVGEARNRGVELAEAPNVAFLSADTEPGPQWAEMALLRLQGAELVYGRQLHAPSRRRGMGGGVGAAVRGLRYHFPNGAALEPAKYASHVNAAIRRDVLVAFPIGTTPGASAVDDVLLARRATAAGHRAAYEPRMAVLHRDVDSWRTEMRKNRREGLGLGEFADELGLQGPVIAWALLMAGAAVYLALQPGWISAGVLALAIWLPALRRAAKRRRDIPFGRLLLGVAASPPFDLAFLLAYARGLVRGPPAPSSGAGRPAAPPAPGREVTP